MRKLHQRGAARTLVKASAAAAPPRVGEPLIGLRFIAALKAGRAACDQASIDFAIASTLDGGS